MTLWNYCITGMDVSDAVPVQLPAACRALPRSSPSSVAALATVAVIPGPAHSSPISRPGPDLQSREWGQLPPAAAMARLPKREYRDEERESCRGTPVDGNISGEPKR
jgi:hypothetical protein